MAPYFRGNGDESLIGSNERIVISHRGRRSESYVVVLGERRLVVLPGDGIGLFVGDVNEAGDGLEPGHKRVVRTAIIDAKSVSISPTKRPVLIWRNDAQDKKP